VTDDTSVIDEIADMASTMVAKLGCTPSTLAIGIGRSQLEAAALMPVVREKFGENGISVVTDADSADFITAVGGDGTIIRYAKSGAEQNKPLLGINAGKLGYMAALEANELEKIALLRSGGYSEESRMLLSVSYEGSDTESLVFNDLVVTKGLFASTMDIEVSCDGKRVNNLRADGIIISTPAGSTGYNLSAGGPLMDPGCENLIITPICAHSLCTRTMIFDGDKTISVKFVPKNDSAEEPDAFVSVDGQMGKNLAPGEVIVIKKSDLIARLINLTGAAFFERIEEKFGMRKQVSGVK